MKKNLVKAVLCFSTVLFCTALFDAQIFAQDAAAIMDASRNRISADTIFSRSRMELADKKGAITQRVLEQRSKDGPKGSRIVIEFFEPKSIAGTRFLTMENGTGTDDRWIFQPDLGDRARRIASSEGSKSFMGTDLNYDDISSVSRDVSLDTHTLLREESYNGKACYVIESTPKDAKYQYTKMIFWIEKGTNISYKIELYGKKGTVAKILETLELQDIGGKLTPTKTKMTDVAKGTSTTIIVERIEYDKPIEENIFTETWLSQGSR
jgi:hypothetical protein